MQDHRQPVLARQFELGPVKLFLALAQRACFKRRHKIIKTNFPDGHQTAVGFSEGQFGIERLKIGILRLPNHQRMDAQGVTVRKRLRQQAHRLEVAGADGWQHAVPHVFLAGSRAHGGHVRRKLLRIKVAVRVNPEGHKSSKVAGWVEKRVGGLLRAGDVDTQARPASKRPAKPPVTAARQR